MKKFLLFAPLLMYSLTVFAQMEAEKVFKKYFSEYIDNYSPESGNIPTDSTIKIFRDQCKRLDQCIEDVNVWMYEPGEPSILKPEDLQKLDRVGQIDSLVALLNKEMIRYKRFLGENHEFGYSKEASLVYYRDQKDYMRIKDIDEAFNAWRELFYNFPKYKYHYSKGDILMRQKINMLHNSARKYDFLICGAMNKKRLSDSVKIYSKRHKDILDEKELYIDTLLMIYDRRIKYLGDAKSYGKGYLLGKKGSYIYKYRRLCCLEEAYLIFKESIEIEGENTLYNIIKDFYDVSKELYVQQKIDIIVHQDNFNLCMKLIKESTDKYQDCVDNENKTSCPNENRLKNFNKIILNNIKVSDYIQRSFYSGQGSPNCESLIPTFEKEFEKRKNDVEWLEKVFNILTYKGCTNNSFYHKLIVELESPKFSANSAFKIAVAYLKKESYSEARVYARIAYMYEGDSLKKSEYLYTTAVIDFALYDFPKSRELALKAVSYRENYGKPYILIAELYAASAGSCGEDQFEKAAVYWAAVDKLEYAKKIDPSCEEEADSLIAKYIKRFPTGNGGFGLRYIEGQEYKVDCWINEITKTRFFKE